MYKTHRYIPLFSPLVIKVAVVLAAPASDPLPGSIYIYEYTCVQNYISTCIHK